LARGPRPVFFFLGGGGGAPPPPPGVAPEASEEWFDSSEVLIFCDASVVLFVHAAWP
jgi:hypothetical protein